MQKPSITNKLVAALFVVAALELFLGGGGRLTPVGPVTLRMVLFALLVLTSVVAIVLRPRRNDDVGLAVVLVVAYLAVHLPATVHGMVIGRSGDDAWGDLQPTVYMLAAPFFALALGDRANVRTSMKLVVLAGTLLAVTYLGTVLSVVVGYLDPLTLWLTLEPYGEFFVRAPGLFFYKGHLYLGIALMVLLATRSKRHWLFWMIAAAMLLTLTRGFILASVIAALLLFVDQRRWKTLGALVAVLTALALLVAFLRAGGTEAVSNRGDSDSQRIDDITYIVQEITPATVLFGEGFGSPINDRQAIEPTYLWILWKAGLPGFVFWMIPLLLCLTAYRRIPRDHPDRPLAAAFLYGTVFVYVQTATNPFLNNPIGMSFVLIAVFSMRTLARRQAPRGAVLVPAAVRPEPLDAPAAKALPT